MVRDYNFRGYSAKHTIMNWNSVRRGEKKNIFPYQEEADIIFNSACVYELAVLKKYAKPLLEEIESNDDAYIEANRLLKFLQYFIELEVIFISSSIPSNISPYFVIAFTFAVALCPLFERSFMLNGCNL